MFSKRHSPGCACCCQSNSVSCTTASGGCSCTTLGNGRKSRYSFSCSGVANTDCLCCDEYNGVGWDLCHVSGNSYNTTKAHGQRRDVCDGSVCNPMWSMSTLGSSLCGFSSGDWILQAISKQQGTCGASLGITQIAVYFCTAANFNNTGSSTFNLGTTGCAPCDNCNNWPASLTISSCT